MDVYDALVNDDERPDPKYRLRALPHQPDPLPPGKVFVGIDIGFLNYEGERPRAGDMIIISGQKAQRIAQTGQRVPGMRGALFPPDCTCKCPSAAGTVFYLAFVRNTPVIHAIDATTATLLQLIGRQELGYGTTGLPSAASLAVDPVAPNNLYMLDDRRRFLTIKTDLAPTLQRGYFGIATFVLTGGQYVFSAFAGMTDPYGDPIFPAPVEPDPPAATLGNCISVSSGKVLVTMLKAPARYLSLSGGVFTTHNLTLNGVNYAKKLRGNIVSVPDKPANRNHRYVLATADDINFSVVRFSATTDVISQVVPLALPTRATQLMSVCNKLLILATTLNTLNSS